MRARALLLLGVLLLAGCATREPAPGGATSPPATLPAPSATPPVSPSPARPASDGARLWSAFLEGVAYRGYEEPFRYPVLAESADGRGVFLAALSAPVGQDPRAKVAMLDAETGALRWTWTSPKEHQRVWSLLHHQEQGLVLVGADNLRLHALDERDGALRWTYDLGAYGDFTALGLDAEGNVLAAGFDGRDRGRTLLVSLEPRHGGERWNATSGRDVLLYPDLVVSPEGATVYVLSMDPEPGADPMARVAAHATADGALRWERRPAPHHPYAADAALSPDGATLYFTAGNASATTLHAVSAREGAPAWQVPLPTRDVGALAVSPEGALVCAAGALGNDTLTTCRDARDGSERWNATHRPSAPSRHVAANGLAFSSDGRRLALAVAGGLQQERDLLHSPSAEAQMASYDARSGKPRWSQGWERELAEGTAVGLLVSRHAPRAYMAGEGGSILVRNLTVSAVGLHG